MRTSTFIFLALCTSVTGCSTYNPVTIMFSNAQGDPVEGTSVQAAPMYFFNPTDNNYIIVGPYNIMEPFPAKGDHGITGENGTVTLQIVTQSPLELQVLAENYARGEGQIAIVTQGEVDIKKYSTETKLQVTAK